MTGVSALLLVALACGLAALAWHGSYSRYVTDDFCSAATLHELGLGRAMLHHRATWSGRYSYYAVKGVLESVGPWTARAVPGALLLSGVVVAAWTLKRWVAAAALVFAIIDASPGLWDAFLWETGSITYTLPLIVLTGWLGLFRSEVRLSLACFFSAALMLFAAGFSETTLAAQAALAVGLLVSAALRRDRRSLWIAASGLAATALGFVIVVTAPGNAVRAGGLPPHPALVDAAATTIALANGFVGSDLFGNPAALLLALVAGALLCDQLSTKQAGNVFAIAAMGYVATFFPSAWALAGSPPPRVLHVSGAFALVTLATLGTMAGTRLRHYRAWRPLLTVLLVVCALIPLQRTTARLRAMRDARTNAARLDALGAGLRQRRGQAVTLHDPWLLESGVLHPEPDHWTNRCVSRYYGVQSIRVER